MAYSDRLEAYPTMFAVEVTGTGQPMILIPGLSCHGSVWARTVERFKDRYECHVITLAGFAGQPPVAGEAFLERVHLGERFRKRRCSLDATLASHDGYVYKYNDALSQMSSSCPVDSPLALCFQWCHE